MNSKKAIIKITSDSVSISIPQFITHVPQSKVKYIKINGQTIYSGNLHHYTRNKVIRAMKDDLIQSIRGQLKGINLNDYVPLKIALVIHNVPNYETVKFMSKKFKFVGGLVELGTKYEPSFDVDNQWIWIKCFTDTIAKDLDLLVDDTVKYIPSNGDITYLPIDNFEDRKLEFKLTRIKDKKLINFMIIQI
jgi:hypothetical protein